MSDLLKVCLHVLDLNSRVALETPKGLDSLENELGKH